MFANEKSIENISQLLAEVKNYLAMQRDYLKLETVEKLTILLSSLILILLIMLIGIVALFYISFMLAYMLAPLVGGLMGSYAIMAGLHIIIAIVIITFRKKLVINPMANYLGKLFLSDNS